MEVSARLEKMILSGIYKPEEKLPSEQALANEFGVSRNVIREAYKSLMERGLVAVKQGKGTFVTSPNLSLVSQALNRFIQGTERNSYANLYEIRRVLEVTSAKLAAKRANNEDLVAMEKAIETMKKKVSFGEEWAKADLTFHIALAKATHNPLFSALLEPIASQLLEAFVLGYRATDAVESGVKYHQQIIGKIRTRDVKGAEEAMLAHLRHSEEQVKMAVRSS
jgi:GntR family transcriptional repressor for pyruvate dehydrogenase complex